MSFPTYWTVLEAAKLSVAALPALAGARFAIRPSPAFLTSENDTLPLVTVSPRRDRWEGASDSKLHMGGTSGGGNALIAYPVLVCLFTALTFDQAALRYQLEARDAVRLALWHPQALSAWLPAGVVFDCEYDPNPAGVDLHGVDGTVELSLQQFTFTADLPRSTYSPSA